MVFMDTTQVYEWKFCVAKTFLCGASRAPEIGFFSEVKCIACFVVVVFEIRHLIDGSSDGSRVSFSKLLVVVFA